MQNCTLDFNNIMVHFALLVLKALYCIAKITVIHLSSDQGEWNQGIFVINTQFV